MNKSEYERLYRESVENSAGFWARQAQELLCWDRMFGQVSNGSFENARWFEDGMLNACYNCVDRHVETSPDKVAVIYDGNDTESVSYTFRQVQEEVMKIAAVLRAENLRKGDTVAMYMAMSPQAVFSALACARLGLVHNAIFGGFGAESLALRLEDSNAKLLIVQDAIKRGDSVIDFLGNTRSALRERHIPLLVFDSSLSSEKDILHRLEGLEKIVLWSKASRCRPDFIPCVPVNAEDGLFYLYTSGSTGRPKGIVHTTAGYLLYATITTKICFDLKKDDVFACTADIGWITGHTYVVYGPLSNGVTTIVFGGTPIHPTYYRLFRMVEQYRVTQLYTAPTVIRMLRKHFLATPLVHNRDLSSLRILGSVGEPINTEAYNWFSASFNGCPVIDTYWQTESGGILIAPIPHAVRGEPECACLPFLGQEVVVAHPESTPDCVVEADVGQLGPILLKKPWPGIARGILKDPERFRQCYFAYRGFYFTGDEGYRDANGHVWIRGRADDVINVAAHRLSTAEIESVACTDENVAEAAVVAVDDEITGQALCLFVVLKDEGIRRDAAETSLRETLRTGIGRIVNPKAIYFCGSIPKTATGKIMRRVLRDILVGEEPDDVSTCTNVDSIESIRRIAFSRK